MFNMMLQVNLFPEIEITNFSMNEYYAYFNSSTNCVCDFIYTVPYSINIHLVFVTPSKIRAILIYIHRHNKHLI